MHEKCPIGFRVDWVYAFCLHLRVCDDNKSAVLCFNFLVHRFDCVLRKLDRVVNEILEIFSMRDVHPEHIYWKVIEGEFSVPTDDLSSVDLVPFAEVESKTINGRKGSESCYLSQFLHQSTWCRFIAQVL